MNFDVDESLPLNLPRQSAASETVSAQLKLIQFSFPSTSSSLFFLLCPPVDDMMEREQVH